jgi:hypothetical protein
MGAIKLANKRVYTFPVENPISNDDIPRLFVPRLLVVEEIRALLIGGGAASFDFELRHSPNADDQGAGTLLQSDSGVNNTTTGVIYSGPFADVPAGDWLWLELPSVTTGLSRPVMAHVQVVGVERGA